MSQPGRADPAGARSASGAAASSEAGSARPFGTSVATQVQPDFTWDTLTMGPYCRLQGSRLEEMCGHLASWGSIEEAP